MLVCQLIFQVQILQFHLLVFIERFLQMEVQMLQRLLKIQMRFK